MKFKLRQLVKVKEGINIQKYIVTGGRSTSTENDYLMSSKLEIIECMEHATYGEIYRIRYEVNSTTNYNIWIKEGAFRSLKKAIVTKDLTEVEWLDRVQANFREA